jgi:hypothetical protein
MSLSRAMGASLLGYWRDAKAYQQLGYLVGGTLMLVGLCHLVAWLVVGGPWEGPVSFRKPFTFGMSFGLTTVTLAWIAGQLRISDRVGWLLLVPVVVADTSEVVWVSLQRWRGVASHFNDATTFDNLLFLIMGGVAVAVTATVILVMTVLAFTRMRAAPSMALAIRAGLLILLVAQGVGGWMIQHGIGLAEEGLTDGLTTFGAAGVMKVPHAVGIHGVQVLPAFAWLLSFTALAERQRLLLVRTATAGYAALVVVSVLQTASGVAPFDLGVAAAILYLAAVVLLGAALVAALAALRRGAPAAA